MLKYEELYYKNINYQYKKKIFFLSRKKNYHNIFIFLVLIFIILKEKKN